MLGVITRMWLLSRLMLLGGRLATDIPGGSLLQRWIRLLVRVLLLVMGVRYRLLRVRVVCGGERGDGGCGGAGDNGVTVRVLLRRGCSCLECLLALDRCCRHNCWDDVVSPYLSIPSMLAPLYSSSRGSRGGLYGAGSGLCVAIRLSDWNS